MFFKTNEAPKYAGINVRNRQRDGENSNNRKNDKFLHSR